MLKRFFESFPTPRFLKFSYVGLHIEPETIHYAELLSNGSDFTLGRYGRDTFENSGNILNNDSLKVALRRLHNDKGVSFAKVALPEEETYLFTTTVSGETDSEIREEIEFNLEENVPISGADALFTYFIIPDRVLSKKKIVVSVVSREVVNRYTTLLSDCGITALSFLVESSALSRAVIEQSDMSTTLLVYLSRDKTVLAVVSNNFVQFTSTSSFGGATFTSAIQKQFDITPEEARKIKYAQGLLKVGEADKEYSYPLANVVAVLKDEMVKVFAYWQKLSAGTDSSITKVIICGHDSLMPGLPDYLSVSLKTPVSIGDIWSNIPHYHDNVPPISFSDSVSYGTVLGLVVGANL